MGEGFSRRVRPVSQNPALACGENRALSKRSRPHGTATRPEVPENTNVSEVQHVEMLCFPFAFV
jgi:hypothetical protein